MEKVYCLVGVSKGSCLFDVFEGYPTLEDIEKCFSELDSEDRKNISLFLEGKSKHFAVESFTFTIKEKEVIQNKKQ